MLNLADKTMLSDRQASWLMRAAPLPLNYSCGTAVELHYSFPVSSDGCSPSEPSRELSILDQREIRKCLEPLCGNFDSWLTPTRLAVCTFNFGLCAFAGFAARLRHNRGKR